MITLHHLTRNFEPIRWDFLDIAYGSDSSQTLDIALPKENKEAHGIV